MFNFERSDENPILVPNTKNFWEADATFNGCPVVDGDNIHMVYRALSPSNTSTVGYSKSKDGIHFTDRKQLIKPEHEWEKFGCEDPRITKIGDIFYIFYTSLSTYPFSAEGIRVGLVKTKDFERFEKHSVTTFNSKAMTLFPEKINGKFVAILTVDSNYEKTRNCLAVFNKEEEIWSEDYWEKWYKNSGKYELTIPNAPNDHIEIGCPPIKTKHGWLVLYSAIQNYFSDEPTVFGVKAMLLDLTEPDKIIARIERPLMVTEAVYERYGIAPNIVFPSGAFIKNENIYLYYGSADTTCSVAIGKIDELIEELLSFGMLRLHRFHDNPILSPIREHKWEEHSVFNTSAIYIGGRVHLLYRAMSKEGVSVCGYATSNDGLNINYRFDDPVYIPRADFEKRCCDNVNSGCEDPRITRIGDKIYILYTAYMGKGVPRVALSSIAVEDFLNEEWNWEMPILISPPKQDDKDAALFPEKINGKYVVLHRLGRSIWIDFVKDLEFKNNFLGGEILMKPRDCEDCDAGNKKKDNLKIGIAGGPIKTDKGWLLLYHGITREDHRYHLWASLLDLKDPRKVLARGERPILEALKYYEKEGVVSHVVFSNGAIVKDGTLFVYYGGADKVTGVATIKLDELLDNLLQISKK